MTQSIEPLAAFALALAQKLVVLVVQPVEILAIEVLLQSWLVVAIHSYRSLLLVLHLENHQKRPPLFVELEHLTSAFLPT